MQNWIIGSSGGGKSYEAVRYHILPALESGRHVITNLPLVLEEFEKLNPEFLKLIHLRKKAQPVLGEFSLLDETPTFQLLPDLFETPTKRAFSSVWDFYFTDEYRNEKGQGPLFVVDEVHLSLPRKDCDKQVEEWQSCHRHFNCDLLFITQSYGKCSAAICDNTQIVYRVRKNIAFGSASSYVRKVQDGFRGDVVNTAIREYDPKFFPLYKSHTQGQSVEEFGANDIVPLWKRWPFIGLGITVLILLFLIPKALSNNPFDAEKYQNKDAKTALLSPDESLQPLTSNPQNTALTPAKLSSSSQSNIQALPPKPTDFFLDGHGVHLLGKQVFSGSNIYYLFVSQNGIKQFVITSKELNLAGYDFKAFSPCLAVISKADYQKFVSCDSPTLLNDVGNSPTAAPHV
jgi:zona occludens toxin